MADWNALRMQLSTVEGARTYDWDELNRLVGGLPPSAYNHPAFWSGARSQWSGFRAADVRVSRSVTFVRESGAVARTSAREAPTEPGPAAPRTKPPASMADILLVTCVKSKLDRPAPARELYRSELFQRERRYAEATAVPWFILSAEHGLVAPDEWLAPYDRYLPDTTSSYRRAWGVWVVERLALLTGPLSGKTVELHASAAYHDALKAPLLEAGVRIVAPLEGLTLGERLAWYGGPPPERPDTDTFAKLLMNSQAAVSPSEFVARGPEGLRVPGLYSWWVDELGAADLSSGLDHPVNAGLIYAGLAGATRWPSGTRSQQTLWDRIKGNHIGGRHRGSTFRLTLGSVLASDRGWSTIDEAALTTWIHKHLLVLAAPFDNADTLGMLEHGVLEVIDPPLNLDGMSVTPLRKQLSSLRRLHGNR